MSDHHTALIYTMVLVSAADGDMNDQELRTIGEIVDFLPVFNDFSRDALDDTAAACVDMLADEDGIDRVIGDIKEALPEVLRETAYALACDITAVDGTATQEELLLLEQLRHRLEVDRLNAAAIERGARARYMRL